MKNKGIIYLTVLLILVSVACKAKMVSNNNSATQIPVGKWELVEINGRSIANDSSKFALPFVVFNDSVKQFRGKDGCNSFGGEAIFKGDSVKINIQFSTKMYCLESIDQEFNSTIEKSNLWKSEGNNLVLNKDKEVIMRFLKK